MLNVFNCSKRQARKQTKREGAEKLYEDKQCTVYYIKTEEACNLYAKGTKWCINGKNKSKFFSYLMGGYKHIILIRKDLQEDDANYKVCIQYLKTSAGEDFKYFNSSSSCTKSKEEVITGLVNQKSIFKLVEKFLRNKKKNIECFEEDEDIGEELYLKFSVSEYFCMRRKVAENKKTPLYILENMLKAKQEYSLVSEILCNDIPTEWFDKYSNHNIIAKEIADCQKAPPSVLDKVFEHFKLNKEEWDSYLTILSDLVYNKNSSAELLDKIFCEADFIFIEKNNDHYEYRCMSIFSRLSWNENTSSETLTKILKYADNYIYIYNNLVNHKNTSIEILKECIKSKDKIVVENARKRLENPEKFF